MSALRNQGGGVAHAGRLEGPIDSWRSAVEHEVRRTGRAYLGEGIVTNGEEEWPLGAANIRPRRRRVTRREGGSRE
jgi:hypothetical protein